MKTLGDVLQIGLAILSVYVFVRVLWRAWVRPLFAGSERLETARHQVESPRVHWSLRDELARLFLIQDEEIVNHSQVVVPVTHVQAEQTDQTDDPDRLGSVADQWLDKIELDRTRRTIIEVMVYSGWTVGEIRGILKGDNTVLSAEIEEARKRLGITAEPRMLRVKDDQGVRHIPIEGLTRHWPHERTR